MSSNSGGAIRKLADKEKRRVMKLRYGGYTPMLGRNSSSYYEKAAALEAQKRLIHGHRHGSKTNEGGVVIAPINDGTGLPDELAPQPYVWKERKFTAPMKADWRPRGWKRKARVITRA